MRVVEKFMLGKRPDQSLCEDALFINDHFVVVIDGATAKGQITYNGHTAGWKAKEVMVRTIKHMHPLISKIDAFLQLDMALKENCDSEDIVEYLRASVIMFSKHHKEIWSLGDCTCMINGKLYDERKKIDVLLGELRAFAIEAGFNDGREVIMPFLKQQLKLENNIDAEFGYAALNGHGFYPKSIKQYEVKPGDVIIFATDGYPLVHDNLMDSEKHLYKILEKDPMCCKDFKSTKGKALNDNSFDDRTYVKFIV